MRMVEGKVNEFFGRAVPYMEWSGLIYGEFYERFHPDAFKKCLDKSPDIYACVGHDSSKLLGRTGANTLKLDNRADGLYTTCMNNGTTHAMDLACQLNSGDIQGMSFTFRYAETGPPERHLDKYAITVMEAELYEVCFTFSPAYPTTDAGMREMRDFFAVDTSSMAAKYRLRQLALANIQKIA